MLTESREARKPQVARRILQLGPLVAACLLIQVPLVAILAVALSWVAVALDRARPPWLPRALFAGTLVWFVLQAAATVVVSHN